MQCTLFQFHLGMINGSADYNILLEGRDDAITSFSRYVYFTHLIFKMVISTRFFHHILFSAFGGLNLNVARLKWSSFNESRRICEYKFPCISTIKLPLLLSQNAYDDYIIFNWPKF